MKNVSLALLLAMCAQPLHLLAETATPEAPDVLREVEARARSARVSKVSYDLELTVKAQAKGYHGKVTLAFTLDSAASELRVDFRSTGTKTVTVNGTAVATPGGATTSFMIPGSTLKAGANTVLVEYDNEYDHSGAGFHQFVDPVDHAEYIFSDFEPYYAHRLFPCFDQPDLKATFKLAVIAPKAWDVVGNAPKTGTRTDGDAVRHEFAPTPPISTYIFFVGVGPWASFADAKAKIPSKLYCRQSMKRYVDAEVIFDTTRKGLAFYPTYFGLPYPFAKYDQLFVPEFNSGAMENAGAVTFHERHLFRHEPTRLELQDRASTILHEMAHMWFGDLVTMRWWDGLWLNESFATYVCCVALVRATQYREALDLFTGDDKARAYLHDQRPTTHPVQGPVADTDTAFSNFDGITYGKGASLLKQLEFLMGEKAFQEGLAAYFRKHAWKNTEISDFFAAMSEAGKKDLTAWAASQFQSAGVNVVRARYIEKAGRVVEFWLDQEPGNGAATLREHRLEVAAYHAQKNGRLALYRTVTVTISGARTRVRELEGTVPFAFIWPNHQDHAYVKVALDSRSLEHVLARLPQVTDSLTRRGVWQSLTEMMRDNQLRPERFIEAFLAHAPVEPDPTVIEGRFQRLEQALDIYLARDADAWRERVHQVAFGAMEKAAAGSDMQKTWFELAAHTATTPASLARFESMLDGQKTVRGLTLDQDKRWELIEALAARGRANVKKRVEAELKRDPTDSGQRGALRCEASYPDKTSKEYAFARIVEGKGSSLDQRKALMDGFHQPHQVELSRPFVSKFFEAIPKLAAANEQELSSNFAQDMFPLVVVEPATADQATTFIAGHAALSDDIRRPLVNQAAELARALAIRKTAQSASGRRK